MSAEFKSVTIKYGSQEITLCNSVNKEIFAEKGFPITLFDVTSQTSALTRIYVYASATNDRSSNILGEMDTGGPGRFTDKFLSEMTVIIVKGIQDLLPDAEDREDKNLAKSIHSVLRCGSKLGGYRADFQSREGIINTVRETVKDILRTITENNSRENRRNLPAIHFHHELDFKDSIFIDYFNCFEPLAPLASARLYIIDGYEKTLSTTTNLRSISITLRGERNGLLFILVISLDGDYGEDFKFLSEDPKWMFDMVTDQVFSKFVKSKKYSEAFLNMFSNMEEYSVIYLEKGQNLLML